MDWLLGSFVHLGSIYQIHPTIDLLLEQMISATMVFATGPWD